MKAVEYQYRNNLLLINVCNNLILINVILDYYKKRPFAKTASADSCLDAQISVVPILDTHDTPQYSFVTIPGIEVPTIPRYHDTWLNTN